MGLPVALSFPPLAGIALLAIYLTVESVRPGTLTAPRPETIPEAIVVGNIPLALEMIAKGLDVNAPARVRAGMFYQPVFAMQVQQDYTLTPLEAGLLTQRIEVVGLLLRTGAGLSQSNRAACLARERLPEALPLLGIPAPEPEAGGAGACLAPRQ